MEKNKKKSAAAVVPVDNRAKCGSCLFFFNPTKEQIKWGQRMVCVVGPPRTFHSQKPVESKDKKGAVTMTITDTVISARPAVEDTTLGCSSHQEYLGSLK